jgi:hypothetical protein
VRNPREIIVNLCLRMVVDADAAPEQASHAEVHHGLEPHGVPRSCTPADASASSNRTTSPTCGDRDPRRATEMLGWVAIRSDDLVLIGAGEPHATLSRTRRIFSPALAHTRDLEQGLSCKENWATPSRL